MQYDDQFIKEKLYPKSIEDNLLISIEINLGLLVENRNNFGNKKFTKENEIYFRDYITHIFGTFHKNKEIISFLGFKCVSGKTVYVGTPSGEGFIFGCWRKKFHHLNIQMNEKGITYFKPIFDDNPRINYYLNITKYNNNGIIEDNLILDESYLKNINNEIDIDTFITTQFFPDDLFFDQNLKDELSGNDYKEIVNQIHRLWMIPREDKYQPRKFLSLHEALRTFEKEKKERNLRCSSYKEFRLKRQKLNKTKKLIDSDKNKYEIWNGDLEEVSPNLIIKNKYNYQMLKRKLAENILDDINLNLYEKDIFNCNIKESILEIIIPEIAEIKGNNIFFCENDKITNIFQQKLYLLKHILNLNNNNNKNKIIDSNHSNAILYFYPKRKKKKNKYI